MIAVRVTVLLATLLWFGCDEPNLVPDAGDSGTDSGSPDVGSSPDGGVVSELCPEGSTLMQFSLTAPNPVPTNGMLDLPPASFQFEIIAAGMPGGPNARFDVCNDAGTLSLQSVLFVGGGFETPSFYRLDESISAPVETTIEIDQGWVVEKRLPPSAMVVEGLDAAIQGDLAALHVELKAEYGALIVGHQGFIAIASVHLIPSGFEYSSIYVVAGGLAPGDAFAGLPCKFGEQTLETSFMLSTATFEVEACTFLGGGETTGYRITSLSIQDSSAELTSAEQQRFEFPTIEDVDSVLTYRWNHHNGCDSFHLALPHAEYAATASPLAGCGEQVPEAPPRSFEDPPGSVKYRIKYGGGAWVDGELLNCAHYLFCN